MAATTMSATAPAPHRCDRAGAARPACRSSSPSSTRPAGWPRCTPASPTIAGAPEGALAARHRGRLCRRRQPRRHAGDRHAPCRPTCSTSRWSRCRAISARRPRCSPASTMPASAPCCSWTATASIRRRWSRRWSATGSMTATTSSTPPRPTARTSRCCAGCRCSGFYALLNWGARHKIPEDAGDFRLLSPRAAAALQADAGAQPLLQRARELDRLPPDPRRLRAGRAQPRQQQLERVLADRPVDRGADLVLGRAAADREPARPPARRRGADLRRRRS